MLRNLTEKLRVKFPSTCLGYSVGRVTRLDDAFGKILEVEASTVEGQLLQQKDKKRGNLRKKF